MERQEISQNGKIFLHIKAAGKKLDCSDSVIRKLSAAGFLEGIKIGGSWYVFEGSLVKGAKELQRRRSSKEILISKFRTLDRKPLKSKFTSVKALVTRGLRKRVK